ncbi:hypothetical protein HDU99_002006 [Rhizoclosmatium hyalinum]|nr:hypothetical protein HDU99_002006 [Rhizoclosmatium hyalinum]
MKFSLFSLLGSLALTLCALQTTAIPVPQGTKSPIEKPTHVPHHKRDEPPTFIRTVTPRNSRSSRLRRRQQQYVEWHEDSQRFGSQMRYGMNPNLLMQQQKRRILADATGGVRFTGREMMF